MGWDGEVRMGWGDRGGMKWGGKEGSEFSIERINLTCATAKNIALLVLLVLFHSCNYDRLQ